MRFDGYFHHHDHSNMVKDPRTGAVSPSYERDKIFCRKCNAQLPTEPTIDYGKNTTNMSWRDWHKYMRTLRSKMNSKWIQEIADHMAKHKIKHCTKCDSLCQNLKQHQKSHQCMEAALRKDLDDQGLSCLDESYKMILALIDADLEQNVCVNSCLHSRTSTQDLWLKLLR